MSARAPLGQLLVEAGLLTSEALGAALRAQSEPKRRLGEILVGQGLVTHAQLTQILSHQLALPWVSLAKVTVDAPLLALVPRALAERHHVVPVYVRREAGRSILYVATDDPTDDVGLRACEGASGMGVRPMVAASDELRAAIELWYGDGPPAPSVFRPSAPPHVGAMRVAASVPPPAVPGRPPSPAFAKPSKLPGVARALEVELAEEDLVPHVSDPPVADPTQVVLVVAAPKSLVRKCRMAAAALDARVQATDFADAGRHVRELSPFALVVTEDVYAFDRLGISNLALTAGALLVIWSDELDAEYLEPLLDTAYRHRNKR